MKLFIHRDLNCGRYLVLPSWQYLKSQIALCQSVYAERHNSNLPLYCTADSATVTPFLYQLCNYSHYLCALLPTAHYSTIYTINTKTNSCWTCHYAVTVLQCVQCYHLPNCTATTVGFLLGFITVLLTTVTVDSVAITRIVSFLLSFLSCLTFPPDSVWQGWHVDWSAVERYLTDSAANLPVCDVTEGAFLHLDIYNFLYYKWCKL